MVEITSPVVVVGAGPYGLSAVAHLRARGVDVRVLGSTMASWRDGMPAGMFLKSEPSASTISAAEAGASFPEYVEATTGTPAVECGRPTLRQFVDYGTWFAHRFADDVHRDDAVVRLARRNSGFALDLASGEQLEACAVVVAAGHRPHAWLPPELERVARESPLVTHASSHSEPAKFAGRRVAVVGAGQSALETATLLSEAGAQATVLARKPELSWDLPPRSVTSWSGLLRPTSGIGPGWPKWTLERRAGAVRYLPWTTRRYLLRRVLGPSGSYWLRDRFERGVVARTGVNVVGVEVETDAVRLRLRSAEGESDASFDHVIAATGYRFDLDRLSFLDPSLRTEIRRVGSFPSLAGALESSVPGMYFTGLAAAGSFGPLLRFVCGTSFASPRLAEAIARGARPTRSQADLSSVAGR